MKIQRKMLNCILSSEKVKGPATFISIFSSEKVKGPATFISIRNNRS